MCQEMEPDARSWKRQTGTQPCLPLDFSPGRPISDFWSSDCKVTNSCCFKPLAAICYSSHRKLTQVCSPSTEPRSGSSTREVFSLQERICLSSSLSQPGQQPTLRESKHADGAVSEALQWRKHPGVLSASIGRQGTGEMAWILVLERPWFKTQLPYRLCDSRQTTCPLCASSSSTIKWG